MRKADRIREYEDDDETVAKKCKLLADLLRKSACTLVYTGAGISTAASIPDYRGPNGVWTLAEKGIAVSRCGDPVESAPTTSHMVLKEMCRQGIVRHILSQNCDGLHLRSGVPQKMLSEIHGNMHIEVCNRCSPPRQFIRPFDVTQNSQYRRHGTGRMCTVCNTELADTIVHFGEVGRVPWPLNWNGVVRLIDDCELILCIGTSLAVLKQYQFLWPKPKSSTQIVIVNLQWTPKDRICRLKINAKCDAVLEKLAKLLSINTNCYCRDCDPVLNPRRNTRICELMERLTDCTCHLRVPRSVYHEMGPKGTPGWWAAGIQRVLKRSHKAVTPSPSKRPAGRPRKRKNCISAARRSDVQEAELKRGRVDGELRSFGESFAEFDDFADQVTSAEDSKCYDGSSAERNLHVVVATTMRCSLSAPAQLMLTSYPAVIEPEIQSNVLTEKPDVTLSEAGISGRYAEFHSPELSNDQGASVEALSAKSCSNITAFPDDEELATAAVLSEIVDLVSDDAQSCVCRYLCYRLL